MSSSTAEPSAAPNPSFVRWLRMTLNSSVGAKFAVAITGLLLVGFVLAHMLGNAQVLIGLFDRELARDLLNGYAEHLKSLGPLLWVARIGLLFILIVHLSLALRLFVRNITCAEISTPSGTSMSARSWPPHRRGTCG